MNRILATITAVSLFGLALGTAEGGPTPAPNRMPNDAGATAPSPARLQQLIRNRQQGQAYLAENAARDGVITLDSGLQYEILDDGHGSRPEANDTVVVHYSASRVDGTLITSTRDGNEPTTFALPRVIDAWREAIPLMAVGSRWRLVVPPELAYGGRGMGRSIGPGEVLVFDLELVDVHRAAGQPANAEEREVRGITVAFKLDPRLTRGLYMGDRWVSPPTFTRVGDENRVVVEARAVGVDQTRQAMAADLHWTSTDPSVVAVIPDRGTEVVLEVLREGRSDIRLTAEGVSQSLSVSAARHRGVLLVEIAR